MTKRKKVSSPDQMNLFELIREAQAVTFDQGTSDRRTAPSLYGFIQTLRPLRASWP